MEMHKARGVIATTARRRTRYPGSDGRTNVKKPDSKYKKSYHHIVPITQHTKDSSHSL